MTEYEFEIVKSAKFVIDAESVEHTRNIVEHDITYYLSKHSNSCYVSNGVEVE